MRVSARFAGGAKALGRLAGWRFKRSGDGVYGVRSEESYQRLMPRLAEVAGVVDPADAGSFDVLNQTSGWALGDAATRLDRRLLEAHPVFGDQSSLEALITNWALQFGSAGDSEVVATAKQITEEFLTASPNSRVVVVSLSDRIHGRMAVIRALFAAEHAPEVLDAPKADFTGFASARGLSGDGLAGGSSWLDVPLSALSPLVFGFSVHRLRGGSLVLISDALARGKRMEGELIDALRPSLLASLRPQPTDHDWLGDVLDSYSAGQAEILMRWWVSCVNGLLSVVLDPVLHQDGSGGYDSAQHFGLTLDLERLFACVLDANLNVGRDELARRLVSFEALDLLEGLGQGKWDRLLSLQHLERTVDELRALIPADCQGLLIPRCEAAVDAVRSLRDGFFIRSSVRPEGVRLPQKGGGEAVVSFDNAVAQYLRLVRNGGHTFRKALDADRSRRLLALHNGELPPELSDVPFVYLLRLAAEPSLLDRRAR